MLIECTIETPQFRGSQDNFYMLRQSGYFDTETLNFQPSAASRLKNDREKTRDRPCGGHGVQFHNRADFDQARIK